MAKTLQRRPMITDIDGLSGDLNQQYVNFATFKGICDDKNYLGIDQSTFEDANNVYIDSDGQLASRPALKAHTIDVFTDDYKKIIKIYNVHGVVFYHFLKRDDTYAVVFKDPSNDETKAHSCNKDLSIGWFSDLFFFFTNDDLFAYSYDTHNFLLADNVLYRPISKIIRNKVVYEEGEGVEAPNIFGGGSTTRYIYSTSSDIDWLALVGQTLNVIIDGVNHSVKFRADTKDILVSSTATIVVNNIATNSAGATVKFVAWDNNNIYYSNGGKLFIKIQNIERDSDSPIIISEDGSKLFAIKHDANLDDGVGNRRAGVQTIVSVMNIVGDNVDSDTSWIQYKSNLLVWGKKAINWNSNFNYGVAAPSSFRHYNSTDEYHEYGAAYISSKRDSYLRISAQGQIIIDGRRVRLVNNELGYLEDYGDGEDEINITFRGTGDNKYIDVNSSVVGAFNNDSYRIDGEFPIVQFSTDEFQTYVYQATIDNVKYYSHFIDFSIEKNAVGYSNDGSTCVFVKPALFLQGRVQPDYISEGNNVHGLIITIYNNDKCKTFFVEPSIKSNNYTKSYTPYFVRYLEKDVKAVIVGGRMGSNESFVAAITLDRNYEPMIVPSKIQHPNSTFDLIAYHVSPGNCALWLKPFTSNISSTNYIKAVEWRINAAIITGELFTQYSVATNMQIDKAICTMNLQAIVTGNTQNGMGPGTTDVAYNGTSNSQVSLFLIAKSRLGKDDWQICKDIDGTYHYLDTNYYYKGTGGADAADNLISLLDSNVIPVSAYRVLNSTVDGRQIGSVVYIKEQHLYWQNLSDSEEYYFEKTESPQINFIVPSFICEFMNIAGANVDGDVIAYDNHICWRTSVTAFGEATQLYFSKDNELTFPTKVTALSLISQNEVAIFFKNDVRILRWTENGYVLERSKLQLGCREGYDVLLSYDGSTALLCTLKGLTAINYQEFVQSTDQVFSYLSENIMGLYDRFDNSPIKLYQYKNWIVLYKPDSGYEVLIYDLRNQSWWKWSIANNYKVRQVIYDNEQLVILVDEDDMTFMYEFNMNESDDYLDPHATHIPWMFRSQKLHFNAPNNYKHIEQILITSTQKLNRPFAFNLQLTCYRNLMDVDNKEAYDYEVDGLKTFIKRLALRKVNAFQFEISDYAKQQHPRMLTTPNIALKYRITENIR